mmetsp:Transcript_38839/g.116768  ORF Transcript_38839/g.116768 Transcript_38839/m.116768 type:complete len:131 (-) Transcript_38839:87-479(-)
MGAPGAAAGREASGVTGRRFLPAAADCDGHKNDGGEDRRSVGNDDGASPLKREIRGLSVMIILLDCALQVDFARKKGRKRCYEWMRRRASLSLTLLRFLFRSLCAVTVTRFFDEKACNNACGQKLVCRSD